MAKSSVNGIWANVSILLSVIFIGIFFFSSVSAVGTYPAVDPNMVLYYHFNNQSAYGENDTHVYDFSGNGNNGTANNTLFQTGTGILGDGSFLFNGVNSSIKTISQTFLTHNGTISVWIYPITPLAGSPVSENIISSNMNTRFTLSYTTTGNVQLTLGNPQTLLGTSNSAVLNNKWNNIVFTYNTLNSTTTSLNLYVNGNFYSTTNFTDSTTNPTLLRIGSFNNGASNFFNGSIDELIIWNRVLNSTEISNNYYNYATWLCSNNNGNFSIDTTTGLIKSIIDKNSSIEIMSSSLKTGITAYSSNIESTWLGSATLTQPSNKGGLVVVNNLNQFTYRIPLSPNYNLTYTYQCYDNHMDINSDLEFLNTTAFDYLDMRYTFGFADNYQNWNIFPLNNSILWNSTIIGNSYKMNRGSDIFGADYFTIFNNTFTFTYLTKKPLATPSGTYYRSLSSSSIRMEEGIGSNPYFNTSIGLTHFYYNSSMAFERDIQKIRKEIYNVSSIKNINLSGNFWQYDVKYDPTTNSGTNGNISTALANNVKVVMLQNWYAFQGIHPTSGSWNLTYTNQEINVSFMNERINTLKNAGFTVILYVDFADLYNVTALDQYSGCIARDSNLNPIVSYSDSVNPNVYSLLMSTDACSWRDAKITEINYLIANYTNIDGFFFDRHDFYNTNYNCTTYEYWSNSSLKPYCTVNTGFEEFVKNISVITKANNKVIVSNVPRSESLISLVDGIAYDATGISDTQKYIKNCRINGLDKPCYNILSSGRNSNLNISLELMKFYGVFFDAGNEPSLKSYSKNDYFVLNKTYNSNLTDILSNPYMFSNIDMIGIFYSMYNILGYDITYLTSNIISSNSYNLNPLIVLDYIQITNYKYFNNRLVNSNSINLFNNTNSLIYFSNGSALQGSGNINITLSPNNYSYVLDNFNLTEGITRDFSPLSFSQSSLTEKHIASNLSETINTTIVLSNINCDTVGVITYHTDSNNFTRTYNRGDYTCSNFQIQFDNIPVEPAQNSNIFLISYNGITRNSCDSAISAFLSYPMLIGLIGTVFLIGLAITLIFGYSMIKSGEPISAEQVGIFFVMLVGIAILIIIGIVMISAICSTGII